MGLYRIAQEALNNVITHAQAKAAAVKLVRHPASIDLIVNDDGRGFSAEENHHLKEKDRGMGIMNMRERAEALNGTFTIVSPPGQGTKVIVHLPLPAGTPTAPSKMPR